MHRLHSIPRVLLAGAALALAACGDSTGAKTGPIAHLDVLGGNAQSGVVNAQLAQPLVVKATDANGHVLKGQVVNFVVTAGGGHVFAGTAITDQSGTAQELWTLGPIAGSAQTVEARAVDTATGQPLVFATFTATATAGAPAQAEALGLDSVVVGVVSSLVEDSFAVFVRDAVGNPAPGAQVTWAVTGGGGTITSPTTTDATGVARTQWTLGASTGMQTATAAVAGKTITFTAFPANQMLVDAGDGQTAGAGTAVTVTAAVKSAFGGAPGLPIHWTVTSGGGSVTPAVVKAAADPNGRALSLASAQWTLGPAGPQTLTASAGILSVTFTATAVAAGTRTSLAQVPGTVLDATSDRVLWLEPGAVKLRTLANGTDALVKADSGGAPSGWLFSAGALVTGGGGALFEYRGGTLASLGPVSGGVSVEGEWAAWSDGTQVIRRNLATGANVVVSGSHAFSVDVGANGDVVYLAGGTWLYHDGTTSALSTGGISPQQVRTDGVNVTYYLPSNISSYLLILEQGANDVILTQHTDKNVPHVEYRLNAGWIAYSQGNARVRRRSPGGVVEQVSSEAASTLLEALGPDGTVVYRYPTPGGRYNLVTPAGTRYDLGPATAGARVVVHGSTFFLLAGGSVTVLSP